MLLSWASQQPAFRSAPTKQFLFTSGVLDPGITFTRVSTGTYFNSSGVLSSAANNAPRFDYDPVTLAARGLLIEEQRTNLLPDSGDLTNVTYGRVNLTVTANAATSPDGTLSADKIIKNATTSAARISSFSAVSSGVYTFSAFVKAGEHQFAQIFIENGPFSGAAYAVVNLTTGTIVGSTTTIGTGVSSPTLTAVQLPNGWFRICLTATITSGTGASAMLWPTDASGSVNGLGDGVSGFYSWGWQLEAGAFATSLIPTAGASATRAADLALVTGTNFSSWYNATEGTFLAEYGMIAPTADQLVFGISDGSTANRVRLLAQNAVQRRVTISTASVEQALLDNSVTGTSHKSAVAIKANSFSLVTDGGTPATDTSGTMPSGVNILALGSYEGGTGGNYMNGWIRNLAYYNTRLTDAKLQELTS